MPNRFKNEFNTRGVPNRDPPGSVENHRVHTGTQEFSKEADDFHQSFMKYNREPNKWSNQPIKFLVEELHNLTGIIYKPENIIKRCDQITVRTLLEENIDNTPNASGRNTTGNSAPSTPLTATNSNNNINSIGTNDDTSAILQNNNNNMNHNNNENPQLLNDRNHITPSESYMDIKSKIVALESELHMLRSFLNNNNNQQHQNDHHPPQQQPVQQQQQQLAQQQQPVQQQQPTQQQNYHHQQQQQQQQQQQNEDDDLNYIHNYHTHNQKLNKNNRYNCISKCQHPDIEGYQINKDLLSHKYLSINENNYNALQKTTNNANDKIINFKKRKQGNLYRNQEIEREISVEERIAERCLAITEFYSNSLEKNLPCAMLSIGPPVEIIYHHKLEKKINNSSVYENMVQIKVPKLSHMGYQVINIENSPLIINENVFLCEANYTIYGTSNGNQMIHKPFEIFIQLPKIFKYKVSSIVLKNDSHYYSYSVLVNSVDIDYYTNNKEKVRKLFVGYRENKIFKIQ